MIRLGSACSWAVVLLFLGCPAVSLGCSALFPGSPALSLGCPALFLMAQDQLTANQKQFKSWLENVQLQGPISGAILGPKNVSKTAVAELGLDSCS